MYPDIFKVAAVRPIPEISGATQPDDFRPISLVSNLPKVNEKVVQSQLVQHLQNNNLLSSRQSGFRPGHSCETLLMKVTEVWKEAIDQRKIIAAAFLDFRKAFDSVNHKKLLQTLNTVGAYGNTLKWFHSYLCDHSYLCGNTWTLVDRSQPVVPSNLEFHKVL